MAEQISIAKCPSSKSTTTVYRSRSLWPSVLRWIPTSTDHILASEKRLLSLFKTSYVQEHVNIGSGPPGSKIKWFRSSSNSPRSLPLISLGKHWGGSSRPNLHAKALKVKTEAWFVDSFEERHRVKNLSNLIILGHSFGGCIASKYDLKHPEHVRHLILVGPAGFSSESDSSIEWLTRLRETWKGAILNRLWESNLLRRLGLGPWGPKIVHKYTATRFNPKDSAEFVLAEEQNKLPTATRDEFRFLEDTTKFHFFFLSFFSVNSASEWKVPTTFIYGTEDWMNYQGAQGTTKGGYFVFLENTKGFHSAVSYVHVGDFSHLTLILNPCLKAWNQLRIEYCNFFTHTFLYNT
ncbi:hypothetical protein CXB51_011773 [Gossypium anomalum]|uniref:AB hydrolase-1 domain-containing protein n=1 Tax=Gossypium anomalum TaxID=47600 RepID=A0A8J5YNX2_9ROSI|nr:hypothetical protein CXB51_011773 [Gossypium anomalum]